MAQIKNFFKIDQEIIYIIKHPKKANRHNVLKLLALLLIFLMVLCGIMKLLGGNYDYCTPITDKLKAIMEGVKAGTMNPMTALTDIREKLRELFEKFSQLAPVVTALGLGGKLKDRAMNLFNKHTAPVSPSAPSDLLTSGSHTVGEIRKQLNPAALFAFNKIVIEKKWDNNNIPTPTELVFFRNEIKK
jgi:hypothetical protein